MTNGSVKDRQPELEGAGLCETAKETSARAEPAVSGGEGWRGEGAAADRKLGEQSARRRATAGTRYGK